VVAKLLQMTGGDNVIFLGNDVTGKPRMKILNYDVLVSEKLPSLNTVGDVLLCDFQHYLIGDRQQIEIAYSEHVAFLSNQSVWPHKGLAPPAVVPASGREADGGNTEYHVWGTKQGAMEPQSCPNRAPQRGEP
jgi:hypothetical protein